MNSFKVSKVFQDSFSKVRTPTVKHACHSGLLQPELGQDVHLLLGVGWHPVCGHHCVPVGHEDVPQFQEVRPGLSSFWAAQVPRARGLTKERYSQLDPPLSLS